MLPPQCHVSVLNRNNAENYHPIKTQWDVQYKRGCCWIPCGSVECFGNLFAIKQARRFYTGPLIWRVRESSTLGVDAGKWCIFRFKGPQ